MFQKNFLAIVLLLSFSFLHAEGTLFSGGTSEWEIVIPENAGATVAYAAEELQNALKKISGAELPIRKRNNPGSPGRIIIGDLSSDIIRSKAGALKLAVSPLEEIALYTLDGNLYLAGNMPRGALYAVYAFLQEQLQVRWFRPGSEGEFMPHLQKYTLPGLTVNRKPSFRYRGLHLCWKHNDAEFETWMARNFINIMRSNPGEQKIHRQRKMKGFHIMISNHNAHLPASLFQSEPECFAELNGKRHPRQICMTNSRTEQLVSERMKECVRNNPDVEILSIFPADNMDYCMCRGCTAQDRSTTWFNFFRRICLDIRKEFPKLKFSTIAYQGYLNAPETDLSFVEFIEYCNHNRCYSHRLNSDCPLNQRDLKVISGWRKLGVPLGIYGYEFDIFATKNTVSIPFGNIIREGIRKFHLLGMQSVITEYWLGFPAGNPEERCLSVQNALCAWLYARLLWNVNDSPDRLIGEWNTQMYGNAAPDAAEIMRLLTESWDNLAGHITNYHNSPFGTAGAMLNAEKIAKLRKHLKKGLEKQLSPGERKNFRLLQRIVLQWEEAYFEGTRSNRRINVPKSPNKPYALPAFQSSASGGKAPRTDAFFSWDDNALNITAVCYDSDMKNLRAEALRRDEPVWMDDSIEIFLCNPANTEGIYKHIAVNSRGTLYDASAYGPGGADTTWNPDIKVRTERFADRWKAELKIPFASIPPIPRSGDVWRFNINRSVGGRRGRVNSGYPESSYHNPNGFAALAFSRKAREEKQILFLVPEKFMKNTREIASALFTDGWNAHFCSAAGDLPQNRDSFRILVIRLPQFGLEGKIDFRKLAKEFLSRGKIVIFSSYEWLPLENYLSDPALKLNGSGWKTDKLRRNVAIDEGKWATTPENLLPLVRNMLSPSYGYNPQNPDGWKSLISLKREDGKTFSTLLVRKQAGGLLIATGGEMGMAGGNVLFGNAHKTVTMLLNNLLTNQDTLMDDSFQSR